ncbi:MAG: TIM barrel protein [Bryobacteraceae bacterium]|nr:TIM barrel protein [Bryobacteraceae bacterium]
MRLGIGTYAYMWSIGFPGAAPRAPLSALGLLEKAIELDVRVVQYGPNLSLASVSPAELDCVVKRAQERGISLEVGTRGLVRADLQSQISLAQRVGANLLRTVPEHPDGSVPSAGEVVQALRPLLPELEQAQVRLAMENSRMRARELRRALDELASPFVGITLDTVNSVAIPEGTREVAEQLSPWTYCLHVKDFSIRRAWHMMGFLLDGTPAGRGQLDVPWLLALLEPHHRCQSAILELWVPEQPALEETVALEQRWAVESVQYLRTLIAD